ncbi:MAG: hypothetical protein H6742_03265 [Alphaproteobacteria bacterium]|nr:hypothetical protein [Alphaproteobacteria bacterium]
MRLLIPPRSGLLVLAAALLAGCTGDTYGGKDKNPPGPQDNGADDSGGDGGSDDGGGGPTTEQDCDDGLDEDSDGSADCLDADCASAWNCNLPEGIEYRGQIDFRGNTIECEAFGIEFDVDVDDCQTDASSNLRWIQDARACPECDRTYFGTLSYAVDSCSEMLETTPATEALFAFVFLSETERELYSQDPTSGTWYYLDTMTRAEGRWTLSGSDSVIADPDDCDNGDQNLGTLTITTSFRDLPPAG